MHDWPFLVQELYLFREFFSLFINSTADIVWPARSEKKKTLYKYASVLGKQQIIKQIQNEGIVPNTTTRDMHTVTLSQGNGQTKCTGEQKKQQDMFRSWCAHPWAGKTKIKKQKRRLSGIRNECIMWLNYKKKAIGYHWKKSQAYKKNRTGTRATPRRRNSKQPSWQYISFLYKADTLANNKLMITQLLLLNCMKDKFIFLTRSPKIQANSWAVCM